MIKQRVLPFNLEKTNDKITSHSGLALFGEFIKGFGLDHLIDKYLPMPGSNSGLMPGSYVTPLVLLLNGGGRSLEDMRVIKHDSGLRDILGLDQIPSSCAIGDWLRRMGCGKGLAGLDLVNRAFLKRSLRNDGSNEYTLDIDATAIESAKSSAKFTYKGFKGYMPMTGHLAENGFMVFDEFREGNDSPGARNLEFLKECQSRMPKGKRIAYLRSDSAAYQARIINHCEGDDVKFAIGADLDSSVREAISSIRAGHWRKYQNGYIGETVHTMNKTKKSFRLIVIKRPVQGELFSVDGSNARFTVIASDRDESSEETVAWYNRRGESSENRIKELKIGFGMERMPCDSFKANAIYFRIGVLAYNLYALFRAKALPVDWGKYQVQTVRWRLYSMAGKVVRHAGKLILKVNESLFELFLSIRKKSYELSIE